MSIVYFCVTPGRIKTGEGMSEFRIHHDVNELLSLLHVRGGDGAEVYIDLLQKNRTPYVTTTVSAHSAKVGTEGKTALSIYICMNQQLKTAFSYNKWFLSSTVSGCSVLVM